MNGDVSYPLAGLARRVTSASDSVPFARPVGSVAAIAATHVAVSGLSHRLKLGSLVDIAAARGNVIAEIISLNPEAALCKPFEHGAGVGLGASVWPKGELRFFPDPSWRGRIIDALARPADGKGPLARGTSPVRLSAPPPEAMSRQLVSRGVATGVKVVDAFTPICLGQRIGIFAGSGVGKSTLLSMLARSTAFDIVIVALVGERGREVREFVEMTLGAARGQAITVVSTGDESAMMRRMAPLLATSLAEHYRDQGRHALLIMDSVTRYAHAAREVALAAGEPPVARGFPPSVFSHLPQLLERAGPGAEGQGSITGIYAVLVDGDDHNDPVADTIRGTLDGHVVLDRAIAEQGRYPAVNLLSSISRLANRVWTPEQAKAVTELKKYVARYENTRDILAMGGYVAGADAELDKAIEIVPKLYRIISQSFADPPAPDAFREIAEGLS